MSTEGVVIEMNQREEKKHSVRFRCDSDLIESIYLKRQGLINNFGTDQIGKVTLTIEVEVE